MSTSYLLDSSILVELLQKDSEIDQRVADANTVYIPAIALGELYYGAEHSVHVEKSLAEIDELADTMIVLSVDNMTARIFGLIKHQQRIKGQMIPDNDLWIAAIAFRYNLTLAARDRHFTWVDGLVFEQW
jgi:tRNA(fMet)-specific endonuclease VapC